MTVEDLKTGPKPPHSTTLSESEEATVAAFRRHTLLPLDDCLYALQPSTPTTAVIIREGNMGRGPDDARHQRQEKEGGRRTHDVVKPRGGAPLPLCRCPLLTALQGKR